MNDLKTTAPRPSARPFVKREVKHQDGVTPLDAFAVQTCSNQQAAGVILVQKGCLFDQGLKLCLFWGFYLSFTHTVGPVQMSGVTEVR